jgi:hypothetical protein
MADAADLGPKQVKIKALTCVKCGKPRNLGRKMCTSCFNFDKKAKQRARYAAHGRSTYYTIKCVACGFDHVSCNKNGQFCTSCYALVKKGFNNDKLDTEYVYNSKIWKQTSRTLEHRGIVELILGRKLVSDEVIHHVDCNKHNNAITNLMVLDRKTHNKLHTHLNHQRVILSKGRTENIENCWNSLIVPITTAWFEKTGANVIKIWEIGQSAAEPLLNAEGSETMHDTPDHLVEGEDIVQTTTIGASES